MADFTEALGHIKRIAGRKNNVISENDFDTITEDFGLNTDDIILILIEFYIAISTLIKLFLTFWYSLNAKLNKMSLFRLPNNSFFIKTNRQLHNDTK